MSLTSAEVKAVSLRVSTVNSIEYLNTISFGGACNVHMHHVGHTRLKCQPLIESGVRIVSGDVGKSVSTVRCIVINFKGFARPRSRNECVVEKVMTLEPYDKKILAKLSENCNLYCKLVLLLKLDTQAYYNMRIILGYEMVQ